MTELDLRRENESLRTRNIELVEALDAAERSALSLRNGLLETAPDPMIVVGDGGAIALVNHQFEALFGYARSDIVGCPIEVLIPPDVCDGTQLSKLAYFRNVGLRPSGERLEIGARRKDGTEFRSKSA